MAANDDGIIFDRCVQELELNGYALMSLHTLACCDDSGKTINSAFAIARNALANEEKHKSVPQIDPSSDSSCWTGYHSAAVVNGRYNQYREGFVFSNGDMFDVNMNQDNVGEELMFEKEMGNLFRIMHNDISNEVLRAIERRLELPNLYFHQEFGPTDNASQWHMKRYVVNFEQREMQNEGVPINNESKSSDIVEPEIFLPVHTDPSLISVVILDEIGTKEGGLGLEVYHPLKNTITQQNSSGGTWKGISHHGHDVAIIFIGSVLSFLTKNQIFSATKHRVVNWMTSNNDSDAQNARMAATLFVRPHPHAFMKTLPSPYIQINEVSKKSPLTFRVWNQRVAKNYQKSKSKQQNKKKSVLQSS